MFEFENSLDLLSRFHRPFGGGLLLLICLLLLPSASFAAYYQESLTSKVVTTADIQVGDTVEFLHEDVLREGRVILKNQYSIRVEFHVGGKRKVEQIEPKNMTIVHVYTDQPIRQWTDKSGNHNLEARLLRHRSNSVVLEGEDGTLSTIESLWLSQDDITYLSELLGETSAKANPFKPLGNDERWLSDRSAMRLRTPPKVDSEAIPIAMSNFEPLRFDRSRKWERPTSSTQSWEHHTDKVIGLDTATTLGLQQRIKTLAISGGSNLGVLIVGDLSYEMNVRAWLARFDLISGKIESQHAVPLSDCSQVDISPDGSLVLAVGHLASPDRESEKYEQQLFLWRWKETELELLARWKFEHDSPLKLDSSIFFTSDSQFCVCNSQWCTFWDIDSKRPEWGFAASSRGRPWISDDGNLLLLQTDSEILQIDTVRRMICGTLASEGNSNRGLAVSPDGNRIALLGTGGIRIIDSLTGELQDEFQLRGLLNLENLRWCQGDQLVILEKRQATQVDLRLRTTVAEYRIPDGEFASRIRDRAWYSCAGLKTGAALCVNLTHNELTQPFRDLRPEEVFVGGPGSKLSLKFDTQFDEETITKIRDNITAKLSQFEIVVDPQPQPLVLRCVTRSFDTRVEGDQLKAIEAALGESLEPFDYHPTSMAIEYVWKGKVIWSRKTYPLNILTIAQTLASLNRFQKKQSFQSRIAEAYKLFPDYFLNETLPKTITVLPEGTKAIEVLLGISGIEPALRRR